MRRVQAMTQLQRSMLACALGGALGAVLSWSIGLGVVPGIAAVSIYALGVYRGHRNAERT
jgi:hypothetical protein